METYNSKKIRELMKETGACRADLKRALGISNESTMIKYVDGEDLRVSRLLQIAGFFGKSISEFFESDGQPLQQTVKSLGGEQIKIAVGEGGSAVLKTQQENGTKTDTPFAEKSLYEKELQHMKEMTEVRIGYERKVAALEQENLMLKKLLQKNDGKTIAEVLSDNNSVGDVGEVFSYRMGNHETTFKVAEEEVK